LASSGVDKTRAQLFEQLVLPHLDAAYNLARWLTRSDSDAEDVVQEACLRALNSFASFQRGRDARPWLLKIVRNTCYTWLRQNRAHEFVASTDEMPHEPPASDASPETLLIQNADSRALRRALEDIALEYREALVLRELEGLSYKEIAELLGVPIGTVMSRLSRGRKDLCRILRPQAQGLKQ
jgi:RNA polymerase sigma-70 factor (ECF subfamily)